MANIESDSDDDPKSRCMQIHEFIATRNKVTNDFEMKVRFSFQSTAIRLTTSCIIHVAYQVRFAT